MENKFEITEDTLGQIVKIIVREVNPELILLFGSRGRGDHRLYSDLDLLIIEREPFSIQRSRRKETSRIRRALWKFFIPIDILVYAKDELDEWEKSLNHILGRAVREGRVLYEGT